ncbi:sugar ABC transporter substrate-binding protein [Metabacillus litoralis]|uniref:Sugar ABC transporter substrate-binding protein n=1 Tax=Metabacillus litoralis TaxID=152268 RepID=A0A5C6W0Y3_9BACI|nr:substrate-binding domain-containing protein [Metabacillus litoralis]TXC90562.1 sugar ABC transporter substrate-binding protein [Metabacillus litoralis]
MKRLLIGYLVLFTVFFIYIYNYHLKDTITSSYEDNQENQFRGDINEKYVMLTFQSGIEYWKSAIKGFEDAANELNVSVEYRGATQYDVHEQMTVLEQVIAKKPDGIALSAMDPFALNSTINKAIEAGIPVILFDSDAPASNAHTFLGTNNYSAGNASADKMAELLKGKGKVAVITLPNQLNHIERTEGFIETVQKKYPGMEVVAIEDGKGDQLRSKLVTEKILKEYPNIRGIFATEANGGVGITNAIESIKKTEEIKVISFDTDKQTLDKIKEDAIAATIAQGTWNMGYWSLQILFKNNHGITSTEKMDNSKQFPAYIDTGITIVSKENVEDFYAD